MESGDLISLEQAHMEFARFAVMMGLRDDVATRDDLAEARADFIQRLCNGSIVINENGEPTITLEDGQALTFHEPKGGDLLQGDTAGQQNVRRLVLTMAGMTKKHPKFFSAMRYRDLKPCMMIANLFFS